MKTKLGLFALVILMCIMITSCNLKPELALNFSYSSIAAGPTATITYDITNVSDIRLTGCKLEFLVTSSAGPGNDVHVWTNGVDLNANTGVTGQTLIVTLSVGNVVTVDFIGAGMDNPPDK